MTDAQKRAIDHYRKENTVLLTVRLYRKNDADIIDWLESKTENKQQAIRDALREYITNLANHEE